jgi:hypothetical protein
MFSHFTSIDSLLKFSANISNDIRYITIAKEACNSFIEQVTSLSPHLYKRDGNWCSSVTVIDKTTKQNFILTLISTTTSTVDAEFFAYDGGSYEITFFINPSKLISSDKSTFSNLLNSSSEKIKKKLSNPAFFKYILTQKMSSFIHEYIHFLDFLRLKDPDKFFSSHKVDIILPKDDSNLEKYYNNEHEYNAHFQSSMEHLLWTFEEIKQESRDMTQEEFAQNSFYKMTHDFNSFYNIFLRETYNKNKKYLNENMKLRIKKRIYQWFVYIKNEVDIFYNSLSKTTPAPIF